ncbi:hypothetical protein [Nitrososphaera sp.]|uniref:hypothetical protein n=1 Tax=Nitrososphaera sp. TaxID=1971748 RepID=UPI00307F2C31
MQKLDSIEKKIDECCAPSCLDFTAQQAASLPNPYSAMVGTRRFVFSTTNSAGLEVKPNPPSASNGLRIPFDLAVEISPPCKKVTVEGSSYSTLKWEAFDSAGNVLVSNPPPPAPRNSSYVFEVAGDVARIEFKSQNEDDIKKICCLAH